MYTLNAHTHTPTHTHTHTVPFSVTIDPPQKVVNISDRAELTCTARAHPLPYIMWTREDFTVLNLQDGVIEEQQGLLRHVDYV